jgi:hypothetical protein
MSRAYLKNLEDEIDIEVEAAVDRGYHYGAADALDTLYRSAGSTEHSSVFRSLITKVRKEMEDE